MSIAVTWSASGSGLGQGWDKAGLLDGIKTVFVFSDSFKEAGQLYTGLDCLNLSWLFESTPNICRHRLICDLQNHELKNPLLCTRKSLI